jgi:hypothetical protein
MYVVFYEKAYAINHIALLGFGTLLQILKVGQQLTSTDTKIGSIFIYTCDG